MTTLRYVVNGRAYEHVVTVDADADAVVIAGLPQAAVEYLLQYGWAQSLQDSIAGRAKRVRDELAPKITAGEMDEAELAEAVATDVDSALLKRAAAIVAGTVGQRVGGGKPRLTLFDRVARELLAQYAKKLGKKLPPKDSDKFAEILGKFVEKNRPAIEAEVQRRIATEQGIVGPDEDDIFA